MSVAEVAPILSRLLECASLVALGELEESELRQVERSRDVRGPHSPMRLSEAGRGLQDLEAVGTQRMELGLPSPAHIQARACREIEYVVDRGIRN
jgi:hypothetical protein